MTVINFPSCILCDAASHDIVAFSAPPIQSVTSFNNNVALRYQSHHAVTSKDRTSLQMALTEEFIQMKVNGDSKASSTESFSTDEDLDGNTSTSSGSNTQEKTPLDSFLSGNVALSTVQSLARVVGSGGNDLINEGSMDNNSKMMGVEEDVETDGFNKGAFGIANVLSGRGPSSRRSRLIKWQRQNLRSARREIATASLNYNNNGGDEINQGRVERQAKDANNNNDGRMTQLVNALPSSQHAASSAESSNKNMDRNSNNILQPNSKKDQTLITTALQTLEKDMAILDNLASLQPQLSGTEVGLLLGAVLASGMGPVLFPGTSVTEVLAPAAAACK